MRTFIEKKIKEIQGQPDHIRNRTVIVFTVCVTIVIVLLWASLLLPAQLRISAY